MKKLLPLLLFAVSLTASAIGLGNDNSGGTSINTNVNSAYAGAYADAYARATAQQAQMQGQLQAQRQQQAQQQGNVQGTTVGGQNSAVTVGGQTTTYTSPAEVRSIQDGTATLRTVPPVSAPAALPTAPCRISHSAGVAVVGFGLSGGTSTEDVGCTMRENARILDALGERTAALLLMCFNEQVAQVLGVCKK